MVHRGFGVVLGCCVVSVAAWAQSSPPPPVKMGLWQANMKQTMTGMQLPPGVAEKMKAMGRPMPGSSSMTVQNCYTEEQWKTSMEELQNRKNSKCTRSNLVQDSHHMVMDIVCVDANNQPAMSGHMEMIFDSTEQPHGTMTMKGAQPGRPGMPISMETKLNSHFVSSSCGDVKPGEGRVVTSQ